MAKLGDIATYINGYAFKPSDWSDQGLPIIRIQDLTGNSYQANRYNGKYDAKYEVVSGDVLISWSASLGIYVWNDEKALLNQHIFKVVFDKVDVDKSFFIHQLEAILERAKKDAHGATMKHLTKPVFDALPFYLPSKDKQIQIASELNMVCELIALRKVQLSNLEKLVKSRFIEMFGDPEKNPKGWSKEILCNHLNVVGGYAFKSELFAEDGIPVLRIGNINAGFFQPINMVYWKQDDSLSRYMMYAGDLVMSLTGTVGKDDYGNVCILGDDYDCYYLNQRNAKLELFKSLDKYYLSQILKFPAIKKKLTGISRGVRQANISNKDILNLEIPIPPIDLQNEFATFVEQIDKLKFEVKESLEKLETFKKSLMQQYFG